jgi:hypothetical protein
MIMYPGYINQVHLGHVRETEIRPCQDEADCVAAAMLSNTISIGILILCGRFKESKIPFIIRKICPVSS